MLAAMERALADDMDVLNMSIGSAFMTWPQYPTAAGADRLVNEGMVVVASIGNSGADGVYSAGAPGVGRKVIGVASLDNSQAARPLVHHLARQHGDRVTSSAAAPHRCRRPERSRSPGLARRRPRTMPARPFRPAA